MNNLFKLLWIRLNYSHKNPTWVECFVYFAEHSTYEQFYGPLMLTEEVCDYVLKKYDKEILMDVYETIDRLYHEKDKALEETYFKK